MEIRPIAYFRSPMKSKFGIPRQSGLVSELAGQIVMEPEYRQRECLRGIEDFDYLWLIWEFFDKRGGHAGATSPDSGESLTVRPPRLGGNRRMGVFATRSPFRPNHLGLSCVLLDRIETDPKLGPVIYVRGADLVDRTLIYDIKPYITYADAHPQARSGFVDATAWEPLRVTIPEAVAALIPADLLEGLKAVLAQDPRPRYHDDPERMYGMPFYDFDIRFKVADGELVVVNCVKN
mgnify:CR=1 FL=1